MTSSTTDRRLGLTGAAAIKSPVRCASTANLTLSGLQTVDGVVLVAGDRVLVKNQTSGANNGIYVADTSTWTRDLDFDGTNDVVRGSFVYVNDGNVNIGTIWAVTTLNPIVPGTTVLAFSQAVTVALANMAQTNITNTFTAPQIIPDGTALNHTASVAQLDQNSTKYLTDTGAVNAYVVTPSPAWLSYVAGSDLYVKIGAGNTSTGASTINVSALGTKNILNEDGSTPEANALLANHVYHLIYDGTQFEIIGKNNTAVTPAVADNSTKIATTAFVASASPLCICEGRLTLTTVTPVTTADVTAATTVYFSPYKGNRIALYDGSASWNMLSFTELNVAVPATTSTMYDVFAYNNAGVVAIEALAWTNDTTRATALVLQNGVLVKSGATTRRYLGSFRTTTVSGQTEDSIAKRYVWNYYNRIIRSMRVLETTASWSFTTQTAWRQARATATNQLDFIVGVSEDTVTARVTGLALGPDSTPRFWGVGIGLDSTTVNSAHHVTWTATTSAIVAGATAFYAAPIAVGRHTLVWLEANNTSVTLTMFGQNTSTANPEQSSISGEIPG